jgi:hypothetical protein
LVARHFGVVEVVGSNPAAPIEKVNIYNYYRLVLLKY